MSVLRDRIAVGCAAVVLASAALWCQAPTRGDRPREQFQNANVDYGWARDSAGDKLRTFTTRPKKVHGKVPAIFFVGWLSCDSVEYPDLNTTDGFGILLRQLIEQSGYATVRVDKPGVGESQGDCATADFNLELSGYQSAFEQMLKLDFIDPNQVFVVGLSNGGGTSVLAAGKHPVRGYVAAGSWGRTWYEHMIDMERRRLNEEHKSPAEVNANIKAFVEFYTLYLMKGLTPGEVVTQHPEWKGLWYDAPEGQYGRPAAFYQQLQGLNLGEAWQAVSVPVLVIHGSGDTIMSRLDSETIAQSVNSAHPGQARYLEIEGMTHGFTVNDKFHDALVPTIFGWMKEQLKSGK